MGADATVTVAHSRTPDLATALEGADVVFGCAGKPKLLNRSTVPRGAAVVDVGITRTDAGLVGDVDPAVAEVAGYLAPVPGGVGPMTRAMLLANVVESAEASHSQEGAGHGQPG